MFKIIKSGGWIMLPIFLCAFAATFIIIERILYFADLKKRDGILFQMVRSFIRNRDFVSAENMCAKNGTPASAVLHKLIHCRSYSVADLKEAVFKSFSGNCQCFHFARTFGNGNGKYPRFRYFRGCRHYGKPCAFSRCHCGSFGNYCCRLNRFHTRNYFS